MKYLLPVFTKGMKKDDTFVDLFGGGMNVVCEVDTINKVAVDYNKYIIALWQEIQTNGMSNIPSQVSEEMYNDVKRAYINDDKRYEDYIIGYVGACCSFGGSWFNGYARFNSKKNEDHIKEAYNGLATQVINFKHLDKVKFVYDSYDQIHLDEKMIVYCDPPYASTKKYETDFDNVKFWEWARKTSKKVKKLFISEYEAPDDFKCVWQMKKKDGLGTYKGKRQKTKIEKLFVYNG